MKQKAWIDVKGPRIFYLEGYTIYWGNRIWSEILDTSNRSVTFLDCGSLLLKM